MHFQGQGITFFSYADNPAFIADELADAQQLSPSF